jgi:hypothetical protein
MTYLTALSPYLQVENEEDREQVMSQSKWSLKGLILEYTCCSWGRKVTRNLKGKSKMCRTWSFLGDFLLSRVSHLTLYNSQPFPFPPLNEFFSSIALLIISVYSIPFEPLQLPSSEILHFLWPFSPLFLLYTSSTATCNIFPLHSVLFSYTPPSKIEDNEGFNNGVYGRVIV